MAKLRFIALFVAAFWVAGCVTQPALVEAEFSGLTMGSRWTVKVTGSTPIAREVLQRGIQQHFNEVDAALSTWRTDSALSRFNTIDDGAWHAIDPELAQVLRYALTLGEVSGGAYDVTVAPLVDLWGFGPAARRNEPPDAAQIAAARERVGWHRVEVDPVAALARKEPGVRLDLSSLGKGRGVDRVAGYLQSVGVDHFLIDLSGKLRASGRNARGQHWRVAVEAPAADAADGKPQMASGAITLRDQSIATAGDYRRYFESSGRRYSHHIDPRTGWPVTHPVSSATVIAADCMQADALATLLLVMPPDAARRLTSRMSIPSLFIADSQIRGIEQ
jgi:FAD:protein FMN transferase